MADGIGADREGEIREAFESIELTQDELDAVAGVPRLRAEIRDARSRIVRLEAVAKAARNIERCAVHDWGMPWCAACQRARASQDALDAAFANLEASERN